MKALNSLYHTIFKNGLLGESEAMDYDRVMHDFGARNQSIEGEMDGAMMLRMAQALNQPANMSKKYKLPFLPVYLYNQASPSEQVIVYRKGVQKKEGKGITAWITPSTSIALIPLTLQKKAYQYNLVSKDGQTFTVAGEFTYLINAAPAQTASARYLYDFTINIDTNSYVTDAVRQIGESVVNGMRANFLQFAAALDIKELNSQRHVLEEKMMTILTANPGVIAGVTLVSVGVTQAQPDSKIAEALRATVTEQLLAEADMAIAVRAKAAELNRRDGLLTKADTDKQYEDARTAAIEAKLANQKKESDAAKANAINELEPFTGMTAAQIFAHAMRGKSIGEVNITSEFFSALQGRV